jgi:uncharacterized RDD family membrane protein YckC
MGGQSPTAGGESRPPPALPELGDATWPGHAQPSGYRSVARLAGFWERAGALVIDVVLTGLFALPALIALELGPRRTTPCTVENGTITGFGDEPNALCTVPNGLTWTLFGLLILAALVGIVLYYSLLEGGATGQTVGKRVLGIRVVDKLTGGPIGTGRGVGRYFARLLSGLACFVGYLWMLWNPDSQAWHDIIVDSYVVKV